MSSLAPTAASRGLVRDLIALTKPRITLLVVITAAGGFWLAPERRPALVAIVTLLAIAAVVMAANTLNCLIERDSDRFMSRTRDRPLPARRLGPVAAVRLAVVLGTIAVPLLAFVANPLTGLLAAVALVSYVWVYTPMKQRSASALFVGGIPGALPPLMGWTAATGRIDAIGLTLFGILYVWQVPHFLAISLFRREEYEAASIVVFPSVIGDRATRVLVPLTALPLLPITLALCPLGVAGTFYGVVAGVLGVAFMAIAARGFLKSADRAWAKRVFLASLVYLTLLFAALVVSAR